MLGKDAQGLICYKVKLRRYNKTGAKVQECFLPSPQEAFIQCKLSFSLGLRWISQDSFLIINFIDILPPLTG